MDLWTPYSWQSLKVSQQVKYPDLDEVDAVLKKVSQESDGVTNFNEVASLKEQLLQVENNESLLLIAGDCSEPFEESGQEAVNFKCALLSYLSLVLSDKYKKKVVTVGRIAGQYAKPRTAETEQVNGIDIYCYKGDIVNSFNCKERTPDPSRLLLGLNTAKRVKQEIDTWNLEIDDNLSSWDRVAHIFKVFVKNGVELTQLPKSNIDYSNLDASLGPIYISHEGLLLNYESALVRLNSLSNQFYSTSADLLWIGERTNKLLEGHMEFFRGIANPVGIKVSTKTNLEDLVNSIKLLNPMNEKGKIILITRLGIANSKTVPFLHQLAETLCQTKLNLSVICDAMHGNTILQDKYKVRKLDDMINEVNLTSSILSQYNLRLNGLHLELTPFNVTECLDSEILRVIDTKYTTLCDPRLNLKQSIQIVNESNIE